MVHTFKTKDGFRIVAISRDYTEGDCEKLELFARHNCLLQITADSQHSLNGPFWPKSIKRSIHFNENIHYPCDVFLPFCDVMLDPTDDRWEDLLLLIDVQQCAGDQLVNLEQQRLVLAEKTHRRDQWLVSSLTVLDSTKQENMLLFVWSKATESKPVKLEASHTVILGSI